ncbi:MAG: hypothetical protein AMJ94_14000 [Deltaproteobacteria bacterium SM23_61]|nr:MAG: hypothetical protein AMJ94_14000 [Deltaproteobacteria bacterium SM23_61]
MHFLENQLEQVFFRLGSRAYDLSKSAGSLREDEEVRAILEDISSKKRLRIFPRRSGRWPK